MHSTNQTCNEPVNLISAYNRQFVKKSNNINYKAENFKNIQYNINKIR